MNSAKQGYCRQFGEQNRKSRIGAQLEPGVVAQKQVVAAEEVHQEEAGEDQVVRVDHLDLRHLKVCTLQEQHFQCKNAYMLNMDYMQYMQNMAVVMICRICRI
jgi:hypothetical protein